MWNNWFRLRQIRLPTMSAFYVVWSIIISIALVVWVSMNRRPNSTRKQRPMTQNRNIARSGIEIHVIDRVLVYRKSWDQTTKRMPSRKCFFRPRNTWYCSLRFVRRWNRPYWLGFRFLEKAGSNYIEIDISRVLFCVFVDLNEVEKRRFRIKKVSRMTCLFWKPGKKANCCNTIYPLESSMFTLFYSLLSLFATTSDKSLPIYIGNDLSVSDFNLQWMEYANKPDFRLIPVKTFLEKLRLILIKTSGDKISLLRTERLIYIDDDLIRSLLIL